VEIGRRMRGSTGNGKDEGNGVVGTEEGKKGEGRGGELVRGRRRGIEEEGECNR